MTFLVAALIATSLGIVGYVSTQWLLAIGTRYEEEYLRKATDMLDSLHARVSSRLVWKGSLLLAVLFGFVGFVLTRGWILPAVFAVGGALAPLGYLRLLDRRRRSRFQEQFPDVIAQVRTAVACGYTLPMALSMAERQLPAPASQELRTLLGHLRLGMSLPDALARLQHRMPSEDLELFAGAITLAERSGGQLGKILLNIEQTIRERIRLQKKLGTMTSRGRMEAWIMAIAPAGLGVGMYAINPGLMNGFLRHPVGIPSLIAAAIWMAIGFLVIRKILTPEF